MLKKQKASCYLRQKHYENASWVLLDSSLLWLSQCTRFLDQRWPILKQKEYKRDWGAECFLAEWLIRRRFGVLNGWMVTRTDLQMDKQIDLLNLRLVDWLANWLIERPSGWLIDRLTDRPTNRLTLFNDLNVIASVICICLLQLSEQNVRLNPLLNLFFNTVTVIGMQWNRV